MSSKSFLPTPPSPTLPRSAATERFKPTISPCEWPELYRPGGLHPIQLGDTLDRGGLRVIRKLGDGSYSTVWLAVDESRATLHKYVAVKVMMARYSSDHVSPELRIASLLSQTSTRPHVILPLHHFDETGPNGSHKCLVYEPMGVAVASGIDQLPAYRRVRKRLGEDRRYPKWMVKRILKDILIGLFTLHQHKIVHGDLQPGNLLFKIHSLQTADEIQLTQTVGDTTEFLERLDGNIDRWAPSYVAQAQPLSDFTNFTETMQVNVCDLGAAFYRDDPPDTVVTPIALRAPELIVGQRIDEKVDIWSFGCLIFELVTNAQLFPVAPYGEDEDMETDEDHMLALNDIIGDIPDNLLAAWPRATAWFGPGRERLNPRAELPPDNDFYNPVLDISEPLEVLFRQRQPPDVDEDESLVIISLVRRILSYDPAKRPTVKELLNEPWFHS